MSELRPFALIRDGDQWFRASHENTFVDLNSGVVELAWTTSTTDASGAAVPPLGAGLSFDNECRLYHSEPNSGRITRMRWAAFDPLAPAEEQPVPVPLFENEKPAPLGDFVPANPAAPLAEPRGLAVDIDDRLFVAETGADRILVYDLWSERLLRKIALPGGRPVALAARGNLVYAVLAGSGSVMRLTAASGPWPCELPPGCTSPSRIAISPGGTVAILADSGTADARIWFLDKARANDDFPVAGATDIAWESDAVLVVARQSGADFLRFQLGVGGRSVLGPLRARAYDGLGIVATPGTPCAPGSVCAPTATRRIGFWTAKGFRNAVPARLQYEPTGRVTTYRLDSGTFQTIWGRLFLDACIPAGTAIRVHAIALDEPGDEPEMPRVPPLNIQSHHIERADLSPPMPPASLAPAPDDAMRPVHRRESGRELPWTQPAADDPFDTYEAFIDAPAGRYLWLTLELSGNTRLTPRVKCLRAEHPAHDYLRRLPRLFSRDEEAASFLRRYLAMYEGHLSEMEARAVDRYILLEPHAAPDEILPWLASFLGLVFDERWAEAPRPGGVNEDARRAIISEAVWLFRYRGTVRGLTRFIELYVGVEPILIEHFRLRGMGGAMVGGENALLSNSVLGIGFRVGGSIGDAGESPIGSSIDDAFRTHAHRFTVIIPAVLDEDQLDVVRHIIEVHRPAHTIFDLCTAGTGMRVGRGLHVEISSVIGRTGEFSALQLGNSALGRGAIIGRPGSGVTPGASRLGDDSRIG